MDNKLYYLNDSGSRWVYRPNHSNWFKIYNGAGVPDTVVKRKAKYYYALGNFVGAVISYKGKAVRALPTEEPSGTIN